jgi:hypothetical protein
MDATTRFLLQPDLAARYGVHKRAIMRWRKAGKFPPPDVNLPNGWPAWLETTIEAHERASIKRGTQGAGSKKRS